MMQSERDEAPDGTSANITVGGSAATTWFRDRRKYIHVAWYKTFHGFEPPETKF
jgi:hypothetical protein